MGERRRIGRCWIVITLARLLAALIWVLSLFFDEWLFAAWVRVAVCVALSATLLLLSRLLRQRCDSFAFQDGVDPKRTNW